MILTYSKKSAIASTMMDIYRAPTRRTENNSSSNGAVHVSKGGYSMEV
jgi:hypothetical protein